MTTFGLGNYAAARERADVLGQPAGELLAAPSDRVLAHLAGVGFRTARRANYLRDRAFAGLADPTPRFATARGQ